MTVAAFIAQKEEEAELCSPHLHKKDINTTRSDVTLIVSVNRCSIFSLQHSATKTPQDLFTCVYIFTLHSSSFLPRKSFRHTHWHDPTNKATTSAQTPSEFVLTACSLWWKTCLCTPNNKEPRRRSECTLRGAFAVKRVRTTCLFSKTTRGCGEPQAPRAAL